MEAVIKALCISKERGTAKTNVDKIEFIENYGLKGDAHAGSWHRQVSLLSYDRVEEFKERGGNVEVGAFGENILAEGIDFKKLPIGTILRSNEVSLLVTQIGKTCHSHCEIYQQVGDCIMPREGIFAKVLTGGKLKVGDKLYVVSI
jgi:MOSC domain-containing protein YiiM